MSDWLGDFKTRRQKERSVVQFNLDVDYVVSEADRKAKNFDGSPAASQTNIALTQYLVTQAIAAKFPPARDPSGQVTRAGEIKEKADRKAVGKIQNVLQRAVNKGDKTVEVAQDTLEWVHDALRDWAVPPNLAGWYQDLLESVAQVLLAANAKG